MDRVASILKSPEEHNRKMGTPVGAVNYESVEGELRPYLFPQQLKVVRCAIEKTISVVCGPPGTGKTIALSTAVATIVSERARAGQDTFKVFVTAKGWKPIHLLLAEIAKRVYHPHVVVCVAESEGYRLYSNTDLTTVPFEQECPKFVVYGVNNQDLRASYLPKKHMSQKVHNAKAAPAIKQPALFEMGVVDEGSQMWCRDLPGVLARLHPRGRFVVTGDPLQMQPANDDRILLGENITTHFSHPVHDSVLLCLLRKQASPSSNISLTDKYECKEALNTTFITKLTHCLRSHHDIADLSRAVYEADTTTTPQNPAYFDRWLRAKDTPTVSLRTPFTATCADDESPMPFAADSSHYEEVVAKEVTAAQLGTEGKVGGLMSFEIDTPEEMNASAYFVFSEAMCVALAAVVQNNFVVHTGDTVSVIILYSAGSPSEQMYAHCEGNPHLAVGTPARLQGQSADVVIVNTGMSLDGKRARYYAPLPTMNVAFSRAQCLQILLVPRVTGVSDSLAHVADVREGLEHMQRYLTHSRNTRVAMCVSDYQTLETVSVDVPKRDHSELSFYDAGVRAWDKDIIEVQPAQPDSDAVRSVDRAGGRAWGKGRGDSARAPRRGDQGGRYEARNGGEHVMSWRK